MTLEDQKIILELIARYNTTDKNTIAYNLRYYLSQKGFDAQTVAESVNISIHTIYQIRKESNEDYRPDFITALKLCNYLGITIDKIFNKGGNIMSVILINDLKGYARLLNGLQMFRLKEMEFIQRGTEFSNERANQLFILHCLNVKSFNGRYKEQAEQTYIKDSFVDIICNEKITDNYITVEQVLKSLQFLRYQIEDHELTLNYKEADAVKWLDCLITDIQSYLLRKYTKYEELSWSL